MGEVLPFHTESKENLSYNYVWSCNCGSVDMALTDKGVFCQDCGERQHSDNWDYYMVSTWNPNND